MLGSSTYSMPEWLKLPKGEETENNREASIQLEMSLRVADMQNTGSVTGQEVSWVFGCVPSELYTRH